jgi:hypothetical protein
LSDRPASRSDAEIVHRRALEDEEISIGLRATPRSRPSFVRLKPPGCGRRPWNAPGSLAWWPRASSRSRGRSGCRHRAAAHRVPRRSAARRIGSSGSGLARTCRRERRLLARIAMDVRHVYRLAECILSTAKLITNDEGRNSGITSRVWQTLAKHDCVSASRSLIRRNIPCGY